MGWTKANNSNNHRQSSSSIASSTNEQSVCSAASTSSTAVLTDNKNETTSSPKNEAKMPPKKRDLALKKGTPILWSGIYLNRTIIAQHTETQTVPMNDYIRKLQERKATQTWDFVDYGNGLYGCRFPLLVRTIYEPGTRVKIQGLQSEAHQHFNGQSFRVVEYRPQHDKYACKSCIPMAADEVLKDSLLMVQSHNLFAGGDQEYQILYYACVYRPYMIEPKYVCRFLEKCIVLSDSFRHEWTTQEITEPDDVFGSMIAAQVSQLKQQGKEDALPDTRFEIAKAITVTNKAICGQFAV